MTEKRRRRLFRAISRLVPVQNRDDWLREWEAELAYLKRKRSGEEIERTVSDRSKTAVLFDALEDALRTRWQMRNRSMLLHDIRYSLRTLLKQPVWTATALGTLALGLGATITIFTLLYGIVIKPLPFEESDRLIAIHRVPWGWHTVSWPVWEDLHDRQQVCEDVAVFSSHLATIRLGETPEEILGARMSSNLLPILRVSPALGRNFTEEEDLEGGPDAVILSHGFWLNRFGGDPGVIGESLTLRDQPHTIVGVMPEGFTFPSPQVNFWVSLSRATRHPSSFYLRPVGRLKDGVSVEAAQEYVTGETWIIPARGEELDRVIPLDVLPLLEYFTGRVKPGLLLFQFAVLAVLLIAALNVANLVLMRTVIRRRETAIREAIGAGRSHLVRLIMTETGLLGILGWVAAAVLASAAVKILVASIPGSMPMLERVRLDLPVLAVGFLIALAVGGLIGLIPALKISRRGIHSALQILGRSTTGGVKRARLQNWFVGVQISLTLMLLISSGLLFRSFIGLITVDTGYESGKVLMVDFPLSRSQYGNQTARTAFYDELITQLEARPGIERASVIRYTPFTGSWMDAGLRVEGIEDIPEDEDFVEIHEIAAGYLTAMGIQLLSGRDFTTAEMAKGEQAVLINETLARRFFPQGDPVGRRLRYGDDEQWFTIAGVVGDVMFRGLDVPPCNQTYIPYTCWSGLNTMDVAVRCTGDPLQQADVVRQVLHSLDRDIPVPSATPLRDIMTGSVSSQRIQAGIVGAFGAVALLLALIGIYGIVAYGITQRTREFGIRMALGAAPVRVVRDVVAGSSALIATGLGTGLAGAYFLAGALRSFLFGVDAHDPVIFASVTLAVAIVALVATWLPARRAGRLDPVQTIRVE